MINPKLFSQAYFATPPIPRSCTCLDSRKGSLALGPKLGFRNKFRARVGRQNDTHLQLCDEEPLFKQRKFKLIRLTVQRWYFRPQTDKDIDVEKQIEQDIRQ